MVYRPGWPQTRKDLLPLPPDCWDVLLYAILFCIMCLFILCACTYTQRSKNNLRESAFSFCHDLMIELSLLRLMAEVFTC